jgi:hypothetical protein
MHSKVLGLLTALSLVIFAGGCASGPEVSYPVTYQIQVGNTEVHTDYGPQSTNMSASQQVVASVGRPLYYQVVSPIDVSVYVYERAAPNSRTQVTQMEGKTFTSSITPTTSTLEFTFTATQPNSRAKVLFTLSDRPIAPTSR